MQILTYIDSGVLIAAARGDTEVSEQAIALLDDPDRTFAASIWVRLEVLPKAIYHQQTDESEFYQAFFESVSIWAEPSSTLLDHALELACQFGLGAIDALHIAAALAVDATAIATAENVNKPIHRTGLIATIKV
ncbi:MAG: PIN domain-containing protein [Cyanobacteria bacterium P01_G01_bin.54]